MKLQYWGKNSTIRFFRIDLPARLSSVAEPWCWAIRPMDSIFSADRSISSTDCEEFLCFLTSGWTPRSSVHREKKCRYSSLYKSMLNYICKIQQLCVKNTDLLSGLSATSLKQPASCLSSSRRNLAASSVSVFSHCSFPNKIAIFIYGLATTS